MKKTTVIAIIVAVLALAAAVVSWFREPQVLSRTEYVPVPEIKTVTKIKRVMVPVKEVAVVEKTSVSEKLKLPEEVANDPGRQVIAAGEIAPSEAGTNVAAVLDTKTGQSRLIAKQRPLPLFGFESKKEIGVRYGSSIKDGMEADLYGRWDFLRLGAVHLGVYGEMNTAGEGKAMLNAAYRW